MGKEVKKMTVKEFREDGYLQELNRRFLHPLGLALEVTVNEDGTERFSNTVWDCREDPEGIIYGPDLLDPEKAKHVFDEQVRRAPVRQNRLGFVVQPASVKEKGEFRQRGQSLSKGADRGTGEGPSAAHERAYRHLRR